MLKLDYKKLPAADLIRNWLNDFFLWGKACSIKDGYEIMGYPLQCKDYMIDTQYRNVDHLIKEKWTKEQLKEVCYYIYTSTPKCFLNSIKSFLHPIEKRLQVKQAIFQEEMLEGKKVIIIKGSDWWSKTIALHTHYLTLIRLCYSLPEGSVFKDVASILDVDNSDIYKYRTYYRFYGKVIEAIFKNPRLLAKFSYTGFPENRELLHGMCGFTTQLSYYYYVHVTNRDMYKGNVGPDAEKLIKQFTGDK